MEPVVTTPVVDSDNKKRQQLTEILGISISPARCSSHIKKNLANKDVDLEIHNLREKIKVTADEVQRNKYKDDLNILSQKVVRISNETSTVVAVICNGFVEDLLKHSINETIANNKKMVDINYIMSGNHKKNLYYSIYHKLPTFANYNPVTYEENRKKKSDENKKIKKNKKDVDSVVPDSVVPDVVPDVVVPDSVVPDSVVTDSVVSDVVLESVVVDENSDNSDDGKTTFNTYIDAALKNVKKDLQFAENIKIRISIEVRDFLSDMIIECIKRITTLSRIFVQQIMGVRTMNANHIRAIVHMFMKDEGNTDDEINTVIKNIDDKIDLFQKHVVSEKANKWAELDEPTKQKLLVQQTEKNLSKKKRDLLLAEKRATEAAERVKKLSQEVNV